MNSSTLARLISIATAALLAACTVHPPGEREERAAALQPGKLFEQRIEVRDIPPFPDDPTVDQLVDYALLTNAELEQRYWEWRSAIEQIPQDGTQLTTLNVAAGTTVTHGHASWGSSTLALSNDPMTDIHWPGKLDAAAQQALENARAAGQRFIKAKYELRHKVLSAYDDYALTARLIRLEQGNQQLLRTTVNLTDAKSSAGGAGQQELLKASNELAMSGNDIALMQSQLVSQRAAINALLSRPADSPVAIPNELPPSHPLVYTDAELVELVAKQNPELTALADEIRGRNEGVKLAKLQYIPDFNLSIGTDLMGVTQTFLGQATIPALRYEALHAAVEQAEANLRASEAMRRQVGNDLAAQVIADIVMIRDADRQLELFKHTILPRAQQIVTVGRSAYETGHASLLELLGNQRALISIERLVADLWVARAKHLAELESITTSDLTTAADSAGPVLAPSRALWR